MLEGFNEIDIDGYFVIQKPGELALM